MVPPAKARPSHIPPTAPPQVQRQVGPAESYRSLSRDRGDAGLVASAEQAKWDKATAGLDEDVLVRAASKARPPLIEAGPPTVIREDLARIRPVEHVATLPQARLQARFEESPPGEERAATEPASASLPAPDRTRFYTPSTPPREAAQLPLRESVAVTVRAPSKSRTRSPETPVTSVPEAQRSGRGQAPVAELPLPPIGRSAPPQVVQRQPSPEVPGIDAAGSRSRGEWVQRAATKGRVSGQSAEEEEKPDLDLDHLARQIYPILKRMLAVERERRSGR